VFGVGLCCWLALSYGVQPFFCAFFCFGDGLSQGLRHYSVSQRRALSHSIAVGAQGRVSATTRRAEGRVSSRGQGRRSRSRSFALRSRAIYLDLGALPQTPLGHPDPTQIRLGGEFVMFKTLDLRSYLAQYKIKTRSKPFDGIGCAVMPRGPYPMPNHTRYRKILTD
jgi:hypothetical protein